MKFPVINAVATALASRPARGAWVEMLCFCVSLKA